jgi:uncharacterized protein
MYNAGVETTWDPDKATRNLKKHGVSLADAALIFEGFVLTWEDARENYGEQRFVSIGLAAGEVVLVVAHLIESDHVRLISARKAEPHEARHYWKEFARIHGGR